MIYFAGRGSYGSVYKARIIESGDIVAIKIIPLTEQDEMESIQKEIAMLRDCNHPNIVRYYGSWRAPDALWIAMEYCAGGSVSDIMHACNAPLEESVISYICGETLAGLVYLHTMGRVHRDIKCGNILLTDNGEVKLADFGVAAQLTSTLSKRNTFIGTPHWMAPEVIQASHYDGKVDIWALGISSIEMAEKYPPRWRVNPNRVIFMVVRDPPPRLAEKEKWTLAFQDFIAQCLAKDPRSRPTARYLQQHKFIARDRAAALRALLPLLHRAEIEYAELLEPSVPPPGTGSDDGYFSWRQQQQQQAATVLAGGGIAAGTVVERPSTAEAEASGTILMRGESSYSAGGGVIDTLPSRDYSSGLGIQSEQSSDYLAAVQAINSGSQHLADLETLPYAARGQQQQQQQQRNGAWSPSGLETGGGSEGRGGGGPRSATGGEAHRLAERLYTIHSSGEVVPLPFLQATDLAPLALLGLHRDPAVGVLPRRQSLAATAGYLDWQGALRDVLLDAQSGQGDEITEGQTLVDGKLSAALAARIQASPILLNLASALASHKAVLAEQKELGAPLRVQEPTKYKAEVLADTLRAILCL